MAKVVKLKPRTASEYIQQTFLDEQEQQNMKPEEKLKLASKNLKAGQTLAMRRETTLNSVAVLEKLISDLSKWKSLFSKKELDFTQIELAFDYAIGIMYEYLRHYKKNTRKPVKGKAHILQLKYYLGLFKKYEKTRDEFADSNYQPFIFLRQWASVLSDASLAISVALFKEQEWARKNNSYFPRCERLGFRDVQRDGERKLKWVEGQQSEAAKLKAKLEEEAKNG